MTSAVANRDAARPDAQGSLVARAHLSGADSQRVFRVLLDTLARPGRPRPFPRAVSDHLPAVLLPVLALADVEVTAAVLDHDGGRWAETVRGATGARLGAVPRAALVTAVRPVAPHEVMALELGRADAPERGARLVLACRTIQAAAGADPPSLRADRSSGRPAGPHVTVVVRGPGVPTERRVLVTGLDPEVFEALAEVNRGFPAGVDTWLVADDGTVTGLPRSSSVSVARDAPTPAGGPAVR
ncbi:hypothetical protein BH24ACT3_BH24ACT3_08360 [soil metagenome]